jgi:hypothetical protein
MRRLLTLLLIMLLPLQFSYAVAASYCQHESGNAAHHFGHHAHVHKVADHDDHAGKGKSKSKLFVDNDCTGCHWGKPELISEAVAVPAMQAESVLTVSDGPPYRSADPHRIERPNWLLSL